MQLHYNRASPFVRKVMAVAIETGLAERIEPVKRLPSPVAPVAEVNADNPLGKIPCLVTDDGIALYDSRVICEYLDSLHHGRKMFPPSGCRPLDGAAPPGPCRRHHGCRRADPLRDVLAAGGGALGRVDRPTRSRNSGAAWTRWSTRARAWAWSTSARSRSPARSATSISATRTRTGAPGSAAARRVVRAVRPAPRRSPRPDRRRSRRSAFDLRRASSGRSVGGRESGACWGVRGYALTVRRGRSSAAPSRGPCARSPAGSRA